MRTHNHILTRTYSHMYAYEHFMNTTHTHILIAHSNNVCTYVVREWVGMYSYMYGNTVDMFKGYCIVHTDADADAAFV